MNLFRSLFIILLLLTFCFVTVQKNQVYAEAWLNSGPRDTCNRVVFSVAEAPVCQPLVEEIPYQQCRLINPGQTNNISSFGANITVRSNDGQPHTLQYRIQSNFCRNGYLAMDGPWCMCNDNPDYISNGTANVPASGSIVIPMTLDSPAGYACGSYQEDFYVTSIDNNNSCQYGSWGGNFVPGINALCSTGITCGTGPPPTPTSTPTPTNTPTPTLPPTFTITGNVFNDANKNRLKDAGETNFNGSITIASVNTGGGSSGTVTTGGGAFTVTGLNPGTYRISYSSLPTTYSLTYPQNGPPPSFQVTVGTGCNTNGALGATCNVGNILNLNFGITNSIPWLQVYDLNIRFDDGFTNIVPAAPQYPSYTIAQSSGASNPGIVFTGDGSANFGQGQASSTSWLVGGTTYPEVFPTNANRLQSSYQAQLETAARGNITPTDLATVPGCSNIANCTLPADLSSGVYQANGNVTLNAYTAPVGRDYIFLISGNLTLNGNIVIPNGSTALFSTARDIIVPAAVGAATNAFPAPAAQLQGFYSAGEDVIIQGINNCLTGPDRMLVVAGSMAMNASGNGGSLINQRDLCGDNPRYPSLIIQARPDFILNAPTFIMKQNNYFREVAP